MESRFRRPRRVDLLNVFLFVLGSIFLVTAGKMWFTATRLEVLGPAGFPFVLSAFWVVGIAILITSELIKPQMLPSYKINIRDVRTIRWLLLVFLTLLYIFMVGKIGFIISSIIYEIVLITAFGATKKKHIVLAIIFAIVITFSIYFAYTTVFHIPLPGVF